MNRSSTHLKTHTAGFTLIELSIVLVIIGLLVGGVLVGRDLIAAAEIRAQISQIEKYNTAVNTFKLKYGNLPGDIPNAQATAYGFAARGTLANQGDGNGAIRSINGNHPQLDGEQLLFWWDLSSAKMIEGNYNSGSYLTPPSGNISGAELKKYIPAAKIGQGNFISVWHGGCSGFSVGNSYNYNYFQLGVQFSNSSYLAQEVSLTPMQAYSIDTKIDDGLPQFGKVMALMPNVMMTQAWAASGDSDPNFGQMNGGFYSSVLYPFPVPYNASDIAQQAGNDTTCYDNNNVAGARANYSTKWKNGTMPNCALAFQLQ